MCDTRFLNELMARDVYEVRERGVWVRGVGDWLGCENASLVLFILAQKYRNQRFFFYFPSYIIRLLTTSYIAVCSTRKTRYGNIIYIS